ncbi:hypothetical protein Q1695_008771 [Nippostrongylus brasiliensis]|nr:hypothetical protein Q1695_008771 [Nippostrongylus brasiliensis]
MIATRRVLLCGIIVIYSCSRYLSAVERSPSSFSRRSTRRPHFQVKNESDHEYHGHHKHDEDVDDDGEGSNETETETETDYLTAFRKCWTDGDMVKPVQADYFQPHRVRVKETAMRVVGITPDCFVYFGWLHQIMSGKSHKADIGRGIALEHNLCEETKPFLVRTEGVKKLLFVGVKRFGRRVLVQSLTRYNSILNSSHGSLIWIKMNPRARQEQFISNEFPPGFVMQAMNNLLYRIFIAGYTLSSVKLLELKIFIDKNGNLIPLITSKEHEIDPVIHAPIYGMHMVAAHDIRYQVSSKSSGFIFVRQETIRHIPQFGQYIAMRVPIETIVTQTPDFEFDGHSYRTSNFTVYQNQLCNDLLGNFMIFTLFTTTGYNWTHDTLHAAEFALWKTSTHRFFNSFRSHRRMAYPHAIHRPIRRQIFRTWIRSLPLILMNFLFLALIFFGIECAVHMHEKKKARRTGLSRSFSAASV